MKTRIVITGSLRWEDRIKIKDLIFNLKTKLKDDLQIISGGLKVGVDSYVKKFCMEFAVNFAEFPPYDSIWTQYCEEPAWKFNKLHKKRFIFMRNDNMIKNADALIIFKLSEDNSVVLDDLIKKANKKNKKIVIRN